MTMILIRSCLSWRRQRFRRCGRPHVDDAYGCAGPLSHEAQAHGSGRNTHTHLGTGEVFGDISAMGNAFAEHWAPVLDERRVGEAGATWFLSHAPCGAGGEEWQFPRGRIGEVALQAFDGAPGPDGLPHFLGVQLGCRPSSRRTRRRTRSRRRPAIRRAGEPDALHSQGRVSGRCGTMTFSCFSCAPHDDCAYFIEIDRPHRGRAARGHCRAGSPSRPE